MSEETLSEFVEELAKRNDAVPRDLIEKYAGKGLAPSEMAAALLTRAALRGPEVPRSAMEISERRIAELIAAAPQYPADQAHCRSGSLSRIGRSILRVFGIRRE